MSLPGISMSELQTRNVQKIQIALGAFKWNAFSIRVYAIVKCTEMFKISLFYVFRIYLTSDIAPVFGNVVQLSLIAPQLFA